MIEIERSKERIDQNGEVFTPPALVNEILDKLPKEIWLDSSKTWLDPTCGDGNFLVEVKRRLEESGHNKRHILENMIYGVDLMPDNVQKTIWRLYGPGVIEEFTKETDEVRFWTWNGNLVRHILCADGLNYDYNFDPPGTFGNGMFSF